MSPQIKKKTFFFYKNEKVAKALWFLPINAVCWRPGKKIASWRPASATQSVQH